MIQTETEAVARAQRLKEYRALLENGAWREELAPRLEAAYAAHREGATQRGRTPQERAEHIEAFHLAAELRAFCEARIEGLEKELRAYAQQAAALQSRVAEVL